LRIKIKFIHSGRIIVPFAYNEAIQGWIYRNLKRPLADFLHDQGFIVGKRRFKLFTFSRLLGKIKVKNEAFEVGSPFYLIVSSPYNEILQSLAENLLKKPEVEIAGQRLFIESISVEFTPELNGETEIKMLSPVTVYSTLLTGNGRKKTYYYSPLENEFAQLLKENLLKKFRAFYQKEPESADFSIEPVRVSKKDEKIVTYKGFIIKGWMGRYRLAGTPELLRLAYEAGLGAKNSQGFGCFEVVGR